MHLEDDIMRYETNNLQTDETLLQNKDNNMFSMMSNKQDHNNLSLKDAKKVQEKHKPNKSYNGKMDDDSILVLPKEEKKEKTSGRLSKRSHTNGAALKSTGRNETINGEDSDGVNDLDDDHDISGSELDDSGDLDSDEEFSEEEDDADNGDMDSEKSKSMANSAIQRQEKEQEKYQEGL